MPCSRSLLPENGKQSSGSREGFGAAESSSQRHQDSDLFSVNFSKLLPEKEEERIFGQRALRSEMTAQERRHAKLVKRKPGCIMRPSPQWPSFTPHGLSVAPSDRSSESIAGGHFLKVSHDKDYSRMDMKLRTCLLTSMDPQALFALSHEQPYHMETLFQLAQVLLMSGEINECSDMVQRCIYSFECHSLDQSLWGGDVRLDPSHIPNRTILKALALYIQLLSRKGTHRTACEVAKLLHSLAPFMDVVGGLPLVDYPCLKSKSFDVLFKLRSFRQNHSLVPIPAISLGCVTATALEGSPATAVARELLECIQDFPCLLAGFAERFSSFLDTATIESVDEICKAAQVFVESTPGVKSIIKCCDLALERQQEFWSADKMDMSVVQTCFNVILSREDLLHELQDSMDAVKDFGEERQYQVYGALHQENGILTVIDNSVFSAGEGSGGGLGLPGILEGADFANRLLEEVEEGQDQGRLNPLLDFFASMFR